MIAAGKLDRQIRIQERRTDKSPSGAEKVTWYDVWTAWAEIRPVSGREPFLAQQRSAMVDTVFVVRYRADIVPTPLNRILVGTVNPVAYDIVEALPQPGGRPDRIEIRAVSRAE